MAQTAPKGPGNRNMRGPRPKIQNPGELVKRLFSRVFRKYGFAMLVVVVAIVIQAIVSVKGTLFLQTLIDDHIEPMMKQETPDFAGLATALVRIGTLYLIGILCALIQNQVMVRVAQGTMYDLRVEIFEHMESLPIKYFDTHAHGDIMSVYTNDVDTLRQLVGQSIPQFVSSFVTLIATFSSMVMLNIPLTMLSVAMVMVMLYMSGKLGGSARKYFVAGGNRLRQTFPINIA